MSPAITLYGFITISTKFFVCVHLSKSPDTVPLNNKIAKYCERGLSPTVLDAASPPLAPPGTGRKVS